MSKIGDKIENKDFTDTIVQSIVLSNLLIEKFDKMIQQQYVVLSVKQSIKTSLVFLNHYVDNVFKNNPDDKDLLLGADVVLKIQSKIESVLDDENIIIFSDRKALLRQTIYDEVSHNTSDETINSIMNKIEELELLKF